MRIATLQFSPTLGEVEQNIARADALIEEAGLRERGVDLLVGPELGLTGYNFPSLALIIPYLEPTAAGPTARWAFATAKRLGCVVSVGYPERASPAKPPTASGSRVSSSAPARASVNENGNGDGDGVSRLGVQGEEGGAGVGSGSVGENEGIYNYNATLTVGPDGEVLAHYRKTHLYYTDEKWALPSPSGWLSTELPLPLHSTPPISSPSVIPPPSISPAVPTSPPSPPSTSISIASPSSTTTTPTTSPATATTPSPPNGSVNGTNDRRPPNPTKTITTAFGICMDLNPHLFLAPWDRYEFSTHALASHASLVLCSMAWLSRLSAQELGLSPPPLSTPTLSPPLLSPPTHPSGFGDRNGVNASTTQSRNPNRENSSAATQAELAILRAAPDTATLAYWLDRFTPLISAPRRTIVVVANRCGIEPATSSSSSGPQTSMTLSKRPDFPKCARFNALGAVEVEMGEGEGRDGADGPGRAEEARYAGSSCVLRVGGGRVEVVGVMGRGEEGVGVVDVDVGVDVEVAGKGG